MKKETWKLILQLILSIITAIATTLGSRRAISDGGRRKEELGSSRLRRVRKDDGERRKDEGGVRS